MKDNKTKLWIEYAKTKTPELKEKIIIEYAVLVKYVAGRLSMYLGSHVDYEDLVGYGVFGLIDAIDKFDINKGVKFETYASLRIRGAIFDNIRKMDWIPRSLRKKQKLIDKAEHKIEFETGREPTDKEMIQELNISKEEYYQWLNQTKLLTLTSLEEFIEQGTEYKIKSLNKSNTHQPEEAAMKNELKSMIADAIDKLTDKEKTVITLYYYEELTLKEISSILSVSESRISQLHTKALSKMKKILGSYITILTRNV